MKTHKHCLPLFIFLITLSGCGNKKKKLTPSSSAKPASNMVAVNIPESQDSVTIPDDNLISSMSQFFDADTEEFVAMTQHQPAASSTNNVSGYTTHSSNTSVGEHEFKAVHFGFDDHSITKDEQKEIVAYNRDCAKKILAEAEKNGTNATLVIEGHACHSAGSSLYNLAKSEKRAIAVAQQLAELGIPQKNLQIVGRGSEMPVIEGSREEQWPNRRVATYIVYS